MTRLILLISIVFSLSLLLQYAVSISTGIHERQWYYLSGKSSTCKSCHPDVFVEIESHNADHAGETKCLQCHRVKFIGCETLNVRHLTLTVSCLECHGPPDELCKDNLDKNYSTPPAGGFGLTDCGEDSGVSAAHASFLKTLENGSGVGSRACLACHTSMKLDASQGYKVLEFNVEVREWGNPMGRWKLSDFRLNG